MSNEFRIVLVVLGFIVMTAGGYTTNFALMRLVQDVNSQLPVESRYELLGWGPTKMSLVLNEYRRLFPGGTRLRQLRVRGMVMVTGTVLVAVAVGVPVLLAVWGGLVAGGLVWLTFGSHASGRTR